MKRFFLGAVALALLFVLAACGSDAPLLEPELELQNQGCEARNNNTYRKLLECVTVDGVREHQAAFQEIADANDGIRASGTPGYDASGDYVAGLLEDAGYDVTIQAFEFPFFTELSEGVLQQIEPEFVDYPYFDGAGFATMNYSGSGDVTAPAQGVDIIDPTGQPANTSTSGCEAEDFVDFVPGNIAIIQRGTCSFAIKAFNAEAAGATGVVIFNEGQEGRTTAFVGTLGGPGLNIPAVGAAYDVGVELAAEGVTARIAVDAISEIRTTFNVLAETPGGNPNNVVMVGAHLDSVEEGPGIQDNGSGSAAILEVALQMDKLKIENKVRFAWWGAEESGLIGSNYYVANLSEEELANIALYLNFDMIGSPNYFLGVYDADQSSFAAPVAVPDGSVAIEDVFESFYTYKGVPYDDSAFSGRSDYQAFINNGIPAGGLFTGAEVVKTEEQAAIWGGTVGDQFDPCYHLACDTFDNISLEALDVNSDAVAFAVMTYAYSTESVNGIPGKRVPGKFDLPAPAGPEFTFVEEEAGGLDLDHHHGETE